MNIKARSTLRLTGELRLLSQVEDSPEVTQRELSQRVGIALGLTNVLLRNLVQKGYIRATQANWKRWIYTLTPRRLLPQIPPNHILYSAILGPLSEH